MSFSFFNKYIRPSDFWGFFFPFHIAENPKNRFTQKVRGAKNGIRVIYNEKYLEVFSQRPFWYKKFFPNNTLAKHKVSNVFTSQTS